MANRNEFRDFMIKGAIWVAVICTIVVAAVGLIWGSVIEGSLIAEIGKYAVLFELVHGIAIARI